MNPESSEFVHLIYQKHAFEQFRKALSYEDDVDEMSFGSMEFLHSFEEAQPMSFHTPQTKQVPTVTHFFISIRCQ